MKRTLSVIIIGLMLSLSAVGQIQTLEATDSLKQRRDKENANFAYHQNQIAGLTATKHTHSNKTFLDGLPSLAGASGTFLRSNGSSVSFSTDGAALTNLNASSLASGSVPVPRLPVMVTSGPGHAAGIVPDPGASAGTTKFLREDATFAIPSLASLAGTLGPGGGGTGLTTYTTGDLIYSSAPNVLSKLPIGSTNQLLKVVGGVPAWSNESSTSHNMLSATHVDSTSASVVRGDLIVGQGASPTWQRLPLGTNGTVPQSNGTDLTYGLIANANVSSSAAIGWSKISKSGSLLGDISNVVLTSPSNGQILQFNGTNWVNQTLSGSGITSLNGLNPATQTFATGTSGTDFGISSSGSTHTFNIPNASSTARGFVSTGSQNFAGNKTLDNNLVVTGSFTLGGGDAISKIVVINPTLDFPTTAAGSSNNLTVTVTGATTGDLILVTGTNAVMNAGNIVLSGWVSAADTVKIRYSNLNSSGSLDPASDTYRIVIIKT